MKVVLHKPVAGLGNRGDIIDVADGFARNSLIPKGIAERATSGMEVQAKQMRRSSEIANSKSKEEAKEIATSLEGSVFVVTVKAGEEGKLFGSVTNQNIVDAISSEKGISLDKKSVQTPEPVKTIGKHPVSIKLHEEVVCSVEVDVVPEDTK